jgi:oligoendopeptidase F
MLFDTNTKITKNSDTMSSLPSWDLTQYYSSHTDPAIFTDLDKSKLEVDKFVAKYRDQVGTLSPSSLATAIREIEDLSIIINKPSYYLNLQYETGGEFVDDIGKLQSRIDEQTTIISNLVTFFDVELAKRTDLVELANTPELASYKYFLEKLAINAKYVLSEDVENVLSLKSLTSGDAWSRFYTDQKAKIEAEITIDGKKRTLNVPGLMDLLKNEDRAIRKLAFETLTECFRKNEENVLDSFNNIMLDKKITDTLRGYDNAQHSRLISNQVSQSFVDSLVSTCQAKVSLVQRYFSLKNDILGITDPQWYDAYASIPTAGIKEAKVSWEECQKIIIETFTTFHPRFGEIAKEAFDKNWIDAKIQKRKYGGAFCSSFAPQYHPVILCNYKEKFVDVSTVAHEMGHLIHSILTEEKQTLINCNYTMSMAEIASLCCETVVFQRLYDQLDDKHLKLKLMCEKVEEEALNIYAGGLGRYTFEAKMHKEFRENGAISKEQVREWWLEENFKNVYGNVFDYPEGTEYTWQSVAHFTYIFYNYVYASGLLISNAIFEIIQNDESKKSVYIEILSSGGSESPADMLGKLGLDIESTEFWQIGFGIFEKKLVMAEELWAEIKASK